MIKMVFCVKKRSDISSKDFHDYWLNQHGPLVKSKADDLNILRYVQSHTVNPELGDAISSGRGMKQEGFEGIAELWWENLESLMSATGSDVGKVAGQLLAEDEAKFIDMEASTLFFTEEYEVIPIG
ncbi:MAG: EthD domain-containing protein [Pseudomonadota bacterium]